MALHGLVRPFGGTFLVFSDYMRGAVRLSALMNLPVTFVWTHDSIGLGEDGPTHQPVEHIAALRAIPNLDVVRPADANEVVAAWREIIVKKRPVGILLSRQNLPVVDRTNAAPASEVSRGAYALNTFAKASVALKASELLSHEGISARVVSAPCLEWFSAQDQSYRDSVLPPTVRARVSVEAGIAQGWREWIGDCGVAVSLEHFGASASATKLFSEFGFTPEKVAAAAKESMKKARP
jgi:transketolase